MFRPTNEFVGQLPKEFFANANGDIAAITRTAQDMFYEFSKQVQALDLQFNEGFEQQSELTAAIINATKEMTTRLRETFQIDGLEFTYYGKGQIGRTFLIQTPKRKYMLKIFRHIDSISETSKAQHNIPFAHQNIELKHIMLANKYDSARTAPKLFMGKFGLDGFILMNFVDEENVKNRPGSGVFQKAATLLLTADRSSDNNKGDTMLDFGLTKPVQEFKNPLVLKIARHIADALDTNSSKKARLVMQQYGQTAEFKAAMDSIIKRAPTAILIENGNNFPFDAMREFGIEQEMIGRRMSFLSGNAPRYFKGQYTLTQCFQFWYTCIKKGQCRDSMSQMIRDALQYNVPVKDLVEMGITSDEILAESDQMDARRASKARAVLKLLEKGGLMAKINARLRGVKGKEITAIIGKGGRG